MHPFYRVHEGKVAEADQRFAHVMALALDPSSHYREGIIRVIVSRQGDVAIKGHIDRSELHKVTGNSLEHYTIGNRLRIKGEEMIVEAVGGKENEFLGLEDPDIWVDERTGLIHLYCTIPFLDKETRTIASVNLGHAVGRNLDSLEMTMPVLQQAEIGAPAKEVSIAPLNRAGLRYNLVESSADEGGVSYSTVRVAIAEDMGKPWVLGETVLHPKAHRIEWIAGHASPGPLLPKTFLDVGEGKVLGIMNGREADRIVNGQTHFGIFSIGLFVYDYERGRIDWISPEPLIRDREARTITFASQFVETKKGAGILYAHVDDSFVRAYTLYAEPIKSLLPS